MFQGESNRTTQGESSPMRFEARHLYNEMRAWGWLRRLRTRLNRKPCRLLSLSDIAGAYAITSRYDAGIQPVPIRQIRGSENRTHDFDADFCPLSHRTASRWHRLAEARLRGVCLPPVELIQLGDIYFVCDGHHRISVARTLGQTHIDAVVTVWEVDRRPTSEDGIGLTLKAAAP